MSPLMAVRYSASRPVAPMKVATSTLEIVSFVFTKSIDWQYEEEERMVDFLAKAVRVIDAAPHQIGLFEVPHAAIAELIVGARAARTLADEVKAKAKHLGIPAYQARMSTEAFDLERFLIGG